MTTVEKNMTTAEKRKVESAVRQWFFNNKERLSENECQIALKNIGPVPFFSMVNVLKIEDGPQYQFAWEIFQEECIDYIAYLKYTRKEV